MPIQAESEIVQIWASEGLSHVEHSNKNKGADTMKCENHPHEEAGWFRIAVTGNGPANIPICHVCRSSYIALNLDKALQITPIEGGAQGEGEKEEMHESLVI